MSRRWSRWRQQGCDGIGLVLPWESTMDIYLGRGSMIL